MFTGDGVTLHGGSIVLLPGKTKLLNCLLQEIFSTWELVRSLKIQGHSTLYSQQPYMLRHLMPSMKNLRSLTIEGSYTFEKVFCEWIFTVIREMPLKKLTVVDKCNLHFLFALPHIPTLRCLNITRIMWNASEQSNQDVGSLMDLDQLLPESK